LTDQIWPIVSSFLLEMSILFLFAAGFHLIMRVPKFLNIAHPDYATLGAYIIWTLVVAVGWNIWLAVVISTAAVGAVAVLIDRFSFRYLRGAPLALLLCSMGVALVVRYGIFIGWTGRFRKLIVDLPNLVISGTVVSGTLLLALGLVVLVLLTFLFIVNRTPLGVRIRALADNSLLAESFGIDTEKTLRFVWFLSGASAPLGGLVLVLYRPLTYDVCFMWILLIIAVSILAGEKVSFTRLLGACAIIAAGMELGLFFLPEAYTMAIGFAILIIAIIVRRVVSR